MSKRGPNHPLPGFYKVQGGAVEDRDAAKLSKQALDRDVARRKRQADGRKTVTAKKRAKPSPRAEIPPTPEVLARAHDREFARMNERRPAPKRVKAAVVREEDYPSYLGHKVRGMIRRVARVALAPLALARAVVDRVRHRE